MHPLLEKALAAWEQWNQPIKSRPELVEQLKGGLTNLSFLVEDNANQFVIRIHNPKSTILGINRKREAAILNTLRDTGIAPEPVYFDPTDAFSVLKYIPGRVWTTEDMKTDENKERFREVMDVYHSLTLDESEIDYTQHLDGYWKEFLKRFPRAAESNVESWHKFRVNLQNFQSQNADRCLVHHDLVPENIIESEQGLRIIDWEYAALGYKELDHMYFGLGIKHMQTRANTPTGSVLLELQQWMGELWWAIQSEQIEGYSLLNKA